LWNTGATTASIDVIAPGDYTVTVTDSDNGCSATTSIVVKENKSVVQAEIKSSGNLSCITTSVVLDGSSSVFTGNATYLWSTGATTPQIQVTAPGDYYLVVSVGTNGCSDTATFKVTQDIVKPIVNISGNQELTCSRTSIILDASNSIVQGTASYLWNTGATTSSITVTQPGVYSVTVRDSNNGCSTSIAAINVVSNYGTQDLDGKSISLCISEVPFSLKDLLVESYVEGGNWKDDNNSGGLVGELFDPSIVNLGDYEFTYTEPGDCGRKITVYVNVNDDCIVLPCSTEGTIEISKVVTANDDGVNDAFTISDVASCGFTAEVQIFNRWGKIVYQSTNYQNNWKGYHDNSGLTFNTNNKLPTGTYYYIVKIIGSGYKPITGYIYLGTH
ncbi:gliding motility-associated C-terminal domain-containing protein, partial [Lutibacter maritimus]